MKRFRLLIPLFALGLIVVNAPVAHAALAAKANLSTSTAGATRVIVNLSSTVPVNSNTKPRSVTAVTGGYSFSLTRVTSVATTSKKLGKWRSDAYKGVKQDALLQAATGKITIKVVSRAGTTKFRTALNSPEIEGQGAIAIMTSYFSGGAAWEDYSSSGSDYFQLNLCADGKVRYLHDATTEFGAFRTEKYGQPWSIPDAWIDPDQGIFSAQAHVVFTVQNNYGEGMFAINEPWYTSLVYYNEWFWQQDPAQLIAPSCDPTF